jgi:hypothetical protein
VLLPLNELTGTCAPDTVDMVKGAFSAFNCNLDEDIQEFIRKKAFTFQERGWSSVYLLFNEEKFTNGQFFVEAYFTLSHKAILLNESISKTQRKRIFKGIAQPGMSCAHFVLIGHLGKNIGNGYRSEITSMEILDSAFEVIVKSKELITFDCVLVECKNTRGLLKIYEDYGFKYLQDDGLIQLFRKI